MNSRRGFTLSELLAVIAILGILTSLAVVSVTKYLEQGRQDAYKTIEKSAKSSAQNYLVEFPYELADAPVGDNLVHDDYENPTITIIPLRILIDNKNSNEIDDPNGKNRKMKSGPITRDNVMESLNTESYIAVFRYADVSSNINTKYQVCLRGEGYHTSGGSVDENSSANALGDTIVGCLKNPSTSYHIATSVREKD